MSKFDDEFESFSIYSILEAENDNNQGNGGNNADNDNFDIDTSLDDDAADNAQDAVDNPDSEQGDAEGGDEAVDGGEAGAEDGAADAASSEEENPEEPIEGNTDVFYTLSAEEQQLKITMLKQQYNQLYSSCDDLIERIDNLNLEESNIETVSKLSDTIASLKRYMSDYIVHVFPIKSFIENDIMLNRFLDIINTITLSFDKLQKKIEKEEKQDKN